MDFNKPFTYDAARGLWHLELHKAPKDTYAQCGVKITIDPGFPTGEKGACYQSDEPYGLQGASLEIRCFDNLSGWTSAVNFSLNTFLEKLIELMPSTEVRTDTFVLAEKDVKSIELKSKKQEINSFWHGGQLSEMENICITSFIKLGFQFNLWSYNKSLKVPQGCILKDASEILPKECVFKHSKNNSYAPFSDWFRFKLLYDKGGRWTDLDVVCMQPFEFPINSVCGQVENTISIGMISLEKGHPLAKAVVDAYENPSIICDYDTDGRISTKKELAKLSVEEQRIQAPWGFLGNDLVNLIYSSYDFNVIPSKELYPIPPLYASGIYNGMLNMNHVFGAKCIHLYGEIFRNSIKKESCKDESIYGLIKKHYIL